jgi:co-chaperonin GroES (HSP10)
MLSTPANNVIVKVKNKYIGNISKILQLSAIQNGSSVDSTELVNIMGEVVGLPLTISDKIGHAGYSSENIQIGDIAIFSFNVIHDFTIPAPDADPVYRNRFIYQGEEYFLADITKIFGVIKDGGIVMLNGFVMAGEFTTSQIIIPNSLKKIRKAADSEVMHYNYAKTNENAIDIKNGDKVYFNSLTAQKYQINNKPFSILQQNKIFGKEVIE